MVFSHNLPQAEGIRRRELIVCYLLCFLQVVCFLRENVIVILRSCFERFLLTEKPSVFIFANPNLCTKIVSWIWLQVTVSRAVKQNMLFRDQLSSRQMDILRAIWVIIIVLLNILTMKRRERLKSESNHNKLNKLPN